MDTVSVEFRVRWNRLAQNIVDFLALLPKADVPVTELPIKTLHLELRRAKTRLHNDPVRAAECETEIERRRAQRLVARANSAYYFARPWERGKYERNRNRSQRTA